ncbi:MAG: hypothetical protein IPO86_00265 [Saprospiraceae bacterium]|nr:hypothetical protein [Saprospiraceae bacterium]
MDNPKVIRSKIKISQIVILGVGGIISTLCGVYLISIGIDIFTQFILGIPLFSFGIYCMYCLINYDILNIKGKELVIKSIFGKTKKIILLQEFNSYTEILKENAKSPGHLANMQWKDLTLLGQNISYKISSSTYTNYPELRESLTNGLKRNKNLEKEWERKNSLKLGYGFVLTGLILIGIFFRNGIAFNEIISSILLFGVLLIPIVSGSYLILKNNNASR